MEEMEVAKKQVLQVTARRLIALFPLAPRERCAEDDATRTAQGIVVIDFGLQHGERSAPPFSVALSCLHMIL